jgi:hypothetical protein
MAGDPGSFNFERGKNRRRQEMGFSHPSSAGGIVWSATACSCNRQPTD